jgi:hypothetical protein
MNTINYWSVLASAIASMVIGSIWYGPIFGKKFMQVMGMDKRSPEEVATMQKSMMKLYVLQFIGSMVMFFVLAWYINVNGSANIHSGMLNAFLLWLGFVVPLSLSNALWGGKTTLFWLNIGNMLVTLLAAGAIIGAWR